MQSNWQRKSFLCTFFPVLYSHPLSFLHLKPVCISLSTSPPTPSTRVIVNIFAMLLCFMSFNFDYKFLCLPTFFSVVFPSFFSFLRFFFLFFNSIQSFRRGSRKKNRKLRHIFACYFLSLRVDYVYLYIYPAPSPLPTPESFPLAREYKHKLCKFEYNDNREARTEPRYSQA